MEIITLAQAIKSREKTKKTQKVLLKEKTITVGILCMKITRTLERYRPYMSYSTLPEMHYWLTNSRHKTLSQEPLLVGKKDNQGSEIEWHLHYRKQAIEEIPRGSNGKTQKRKTQNRSH